MEIIADEPTAPDSPDKNLDRTTAQLVFVSGETNPLLFLNQFDKCKDLKTKNDKMYKIRDFVDECHKGKKSVEFLVVRFVILLLLS